MSYTFFSFLKSCLLEEPPLPPPSHGWFSLMKSQNCLNCLLCYVGIYYVGIYYVGIYYVSIYYVSIYYVDIFMWVFIMWVFIMWVFIM